MTDLNSLSISGTPSIVKQFRVEGSSLVLRSKTLPYSFLMIV